MMLEHKKRLGLEELEAQAAFDLPDREMMLVTIVINNVLNNLNIEIPIQNNKVAVQVCAVVNLLSSVGLTSQPLTCEVMQ